MLRRLESAAGKRAIGWIACLPVWIAFAFSVYGFMQLLGLEPAQRLLIDRLFTWIAIGNLHADVAFQLDPLSADEIARVARGRIDHALDESSLRDIGGVVRTLLVEAAATAAVAATAMVAATSG